MLGRLIIGFYCVFFLAAESPAAIAASLHDPLKIEDPTGFLDHRDEDGVSLREHGVTSYVRPHIEGHPHLGGLIVTTIKKANKEEDDSTEEENQRDCGYLAAKVVDSIKYHLARRQRHHFVSAEETRTFVDLKEGENGKDVLTETMRVLSNYTLAEGVSAGTLWTIDNQNHLISCEENIEMRLDEHNFNEYGDALIQGDMAVTSSMCRYNERSSMVSNVTFDVGTLNCVGVTACQFAHPDEAVHFCNTHPECTLVMGKEDATNCEGGLGCYKPAMGEPMEDLSWSVGGGRTYIKDCPGALLEVEDAAQSFNSLRNSGMRWNGGEISYCFAAEVSPLVQQTFHIAVERLKSQVPCLRFQFIERHNDTHCENIPSIIVQAKNSGCWSYVGQVSGTRDSSWKLRSQPLNLGRGCELVGIAQHQLGHALGLVHENARADRDKVLKFNDTNVAEGKNHNFQKSSDVVKYAWAGHNKCGETRIGTTKASMTATDCLAVDGVHEGDAGATGAKVQCQLDLCETGTLFPAPSNKCAEKVAAMSIKMERRDCQRGRGTAMAIHLTLDGTDDSAKEAPTQPASLLEDPLEWVDCEFDLCTDMGLHLAKPFACANKLAYGYISTQAADCSNMGGTTAVEHAGLDWVNCYMDFCSGELDRPFDFLSLMMYSPYAWSKTGHAKTLEPLGEHAAELTDIMGQRMGFSGLDIFHIGHMYNCYEQIKPDFDSKDVSHNMVTGEFFEYNETCEDLTPDKTMFDIHGDAGFMKYASCTDMKQYCKNETIGPAVRKACPVSCFVCFPHALHGSVVQHKGGPCFDSVNTGIRFRDGPHATCKDLVNYCNHTTIGPHVTQACKLSCGECDIHVVSPWLGVDHKCEDAQEEEEPKFTIEGKSAPCEEMDKYCTGHVESYLIQRKCPSTCGLCDGVIPTPPPQKVDDIHIPGDEGGCGRRRRFGYCSTRRRRNV